MDPEHLLAQYNHQDEYDEGGEQLFERPIPSLKLRQSVSTGTGGGGDAPHLRQHGRSPGRALEHKGAGHAWRQRKIPAARQAGEHSSDTLGCAQRFRIMIEITLPPRIAFFPPVSSSYMLSLAGRAPRLAAKQE